MEMHRIRAWASNVFDTHPSIDKRVAASRRIRGHDPGPLALPVPTNQRRTPHRRQKQRPAMGEAEPQSGGDKLRTRPPVE
jgi:hypothetical protein